MQDKGYLQLLFQRYYPHILPELKDPVMICSLTTIASTSAVSQKIHFAINVVHDHYGSLDEMGITGDMINDVLWKIAESYFVEFIDIEKDLRKSRPLDVV